MKNRLFILIFLLTFAFHPFNLQSLDKDKVFEQLRNRYISAKSLKISFYLANSEINGNLIFQHPSKFRLELIKGNTTENIIVSDGNTLWNYNVPNNNIVISKVVETEDFSLQTFFTNLTDKYKPVSLAKEINSNMGSTLVLTLKQEDVPETFAKIYLDKSMNIKALKIEQDNSNFLYVIKRIQTNIKLPKNFFEFKPPKNANIFDYR